MLLTSKLGLPRAWRFVFVALVSLCLSRPTLAHDGLHERIATATREIEEAPKVAALFVARADLYRQHAHWDLAFEDLKSARDLGGEETELDLVRGELLHDLRSEKIASEALDKFLSQNPRHTRGLSVRAVVLEALGEYRLAANDWSSIIKWSQQLRPDHFVSRAQCVSKLGDKHLAEALGGLDEGLALLGSLPSLHLCAVELEVRTAKFDAALARIERLIATTQQNGSWLAKKGDVLATAGRNKEAKLAYEDALRAISKLRPKRRRTQSAIDLMTHILARLKELKKSDNS